MYYKFGAAALCLLSSTFVQASPHDKGMFVGASAGYIESDTITDTSGEDKMSLTSGELNFGYKYNNWLGIDIRYGMGLNKRKRDIPGSVNEHWYDVDHYSSIYWRPEVTNEDASLYFLLGTTSLEATITTKDNDYSTVGETSYSESGVSYGIGAGWYYGDNTTINLEYRVLLDKDDETFSTVNFGVDYRFNFWKL